MAKKKSRRKRKPRQGGPRRFKIAVAFLGLVSVLLFAVAAIFTYHTLQFTALVDARLQGESTEHPATIYAKPFELRRGQRLSRNELIGVLNDLGYRQRATLGDEPATFSVTEQGPVHVRRRG